MFYDLVLRNSRRSRKENSLFFASLLVSIIAFYIILSLSGQDVMIFLKEMESDAVDRLLTMIPVFYVMTLGILFFLVYFATRFQIQRRKSELGMYLMMGMRRGRLFLMLLLEELGSSALALLIGLPLAVLLSEIISLVTAKMVGLDIIGHTFSLSPEAVAWTAAGFLVIRLAAFLILSGKISRQEIGDLLTDQPEGTKKQRPAPVYVISLVFGIIFLVAAYALAISGISWQRIDLLGLTVVLGFTGTLLLFYGLRAGMELLVRAGKSNKDLRVFNFRQIQENVIRQSATLAVSSMLILAALCYFGAGVGIASFYGEQDPHVLDYTFSGYAEEDGMLREEEILAELETYGFSDDFSALFSVRTGHIRTTEDYDNALDLKNVLLALEEEPESYERDVLMQNLSYASYPHLIAQSGYNELLRAAGVPEVHLAKGEAGVYMDPDFAVKERVEMLDRVLSDCPEVTLDGETLRLTGQVQSVNIVTDRSITLSFALILPDDVFEYYTQGEYDTYVNGIMADSLKKNDSLIMAFSRMNEKLDQKLDATGVIYESYLQNIGRQLFYMVAASYITIYLAVIFLITANTVMGVQFLMNQQKTNRRYRTLVRLGAGYRTICRSAKKQINWFFGIPTVVAAVSSLFGVRALFSGILSSRTQSDAGGMMLVSAAMIVLLCVAEVIYMATVKRSSNRYLMRMMTPEREE